MFTMWEMEEFREGGGSLVRKEEKRDGVIGKWKYNENRYFRGEIWRRERRWNRVKEKSFVLVFFRGWLTIDCCEQFR